MQFQEYMAESGKHMDQARYMSVPFAEWLMGFSVILLTRAVVRSKMKLCVSAGLDFAKTDSLGKSVLFEPCPLTSHGRMSRKV